MEYNFVFLNKCKVLRSILTEALPPNIWVAKTPNLNSTENEKENI